MPRLASCDKHVHFVAGCLECRERSRNYQKYRKDYKHFHYTQHFARYKERREAWRAAHPEYKEDPIKRQTRWHSYYENQIQRPKKRHELLVHYGGDPPKCSCCGETIDEFLTLHHINGDGSYMRKNVHGDSFLSLYSWVKKNNFPPIFSVLCFNCNWAMGHRGNGNKICPHQKLKQGVVNNEPS